MRAGIFYLSLIGGRQDQQPIALPGGGLVYVRVDETIVKSLDEALDRAKPRQGETVMNAHAVTEDFFGGFE